MRAISLKLPDELLDEAGSLAEAEGLSRAEYIRRAIEETNRRLRTDRIELELEASSLRVRDESMEVLADFETADEALLRDHPDG